MTWRQFFRELERVEKARVRQRQRDERDAMRQYRAMQREQAARAKEYARQQKEQELQDAADEVAQFERYLDLLVSVHKDCSDPWDWPAYAIAAEPVGPVRDDTASRSARADLDAYAPGWFERVFGGAKRRLAELEIALNRAIAGEELLFREATATYEREHAAWRSCRDVGTRIVAGDVRAYGEALVVSGAFDELRAFHTRVDVIGARADAMAFTCQVTDDEVVPSDELSLTAKGKISTKAMAKGRYWLLYQDHLCSAAMRVGREALAVLPVERVVVNIGPVQVNPSTGHREPFTFLAAQFTRENLGKLNLRRIDPSDAMSNFPCRMRFKKTSGFEPIDRMTLDENWMTSG